MNKILATFAAIFFVFIVWVIYAANTGGQNIFFRQIKLVPYGDKLGHFLLFGILTSLVILGSKFRSFQFKRINIYYGTLLVSLFVLFEELSQIYIPSRTFDFLDLSADALGISLATGITDISKKYFRSLRYFPA